MINTVLNKISFRQNWRRYINLKGIASGRYAYKGPDVVQIDLTDRCNSACLVCWTHSPFVKSTHTNVDELDPRVLKGFINEIAAYGVKEIIFSGGGEPFCHDRVWEILESTQKAGIPFRINTNFTLLNKRDILRLVSFDKLISLTASIWAADADMFAKLHNRDRELFYKIKENLKFFNKVKRSSLRATIYANINNINCLCLRNLADLAFETGSKNIEFGIPDIIPKVTDSFLLKESQLKSVREDFLAICGERNNKFTGVRVANKELFLKRISDPGARSGEYNSFMKEHPCYAGWLFLRLRANGDFNSCLKSHRVPIGNIYKDSFVSVWNNPLQQEFREKSISRRKDNDYFRFIGNADDGSIGCRFVCDNILVNQSYNRVIKYFFWL